MGMSFITLHLQSCKSNLTIKQSSFIKLMESSSSAKKSNLCEASNVSDTADTG